MECSVITKLCRCNYCEYGTNKIDLRKPIPMSKFRKDYGNVLKCMFGCIVRIAIENYIFLSTVVIQLILLIILIQLNRTIKQ